ncbi:hypothetical protein [Pseudomonas sp. NFX224]|uniref:hypothetical protein n=1 Tax=Pseudomonas sp. NFX224 TaxID=3402862 RepID=UPI003AFAD0B2
MFDPDAYMIKKLPWLVFFAVVFAGGFKIYEFPNYWYLYFLLSFAMLGVTLYLAYRCERYTNFVLVTLCAGLYSFMYLMCSLSYLILRKDIGFDVGPAAMLGVAPVLVVVALFVLIYFTKSSYFPFEINSGRVAVRDFKAKDFGIVGGVLVGVSTLIGSLFIKSVGSFNAGAASIFFGTFICVFLLIRLRHTIRGIRTLRLQERGIPTPYTFMRIDEIREARNRWWMGRLLKWLGTLRTSA